MPRLPAVLAIGLCVLLLAAVPAGARGAYIQQISSRAPSEAFIRQAGGPVVRIAFYRSTRTRSRQPASPIPAYAAPGLSGDTALGFFLNNNRGLLPEHERIFRDFLR